MDIEFISPKISTALRLLSPTGGAHFPSEARDSSRLRISDSETSKQWFERISKNLQQPEKCFVAENIALFGDATWGDDHLKALDIQALCLTEGTVEDLYADPTTIKESACHYFRLDVDFYALGHMFRKPIPHIHSRTIEEPRFHFKSQNSAALIPEFITFLFHLSR